MPNYKEKIAEFENNFSTVIDKSVRDLSMAFDNLYLDKNAKEIPPTIKLAEALLSGEHNISTKMQIHYDIANAYHDLRMIEGVYSERYLEKELYHLRCALDMYETNYKTSTEEANEHYSDRELDLVDTGDSSDHSLRESMLRTAFKAAYSLFDRIGFFINQYFEVGLTDTKVSFKNIWKEQLIDGNGQVYFTIPKPIMNTHSDNPLVKAMYWLQKDFYERKEINVTTPHAERIFQMRNDIEHNCLRTGTQSHNTSFTKYTTEGKIENNTFRLLKLARELIIYLCLAVNFDREKDKRASMEE